MKTLKRLWRQFVAYANRPMVGDPFCCPVDRCEKCGHVKHSGAGGGPG